MKTKCLVLLLMLTPVCGFAQDCPCIKTALIGTNANAPVAHNNSVTAMDDREITRGESVELVTKEHAGAIAWYHGDEELAERRVSPEETTEYTVKSSLPGCPDAFDRVVISVRGLSKADPAETVSVYPSPVQGLLTVISSDRAIRQVQVTALSGSILLNRSYNGNSKQETLNVSTLEPGVYFVRIELSEHIAVLKKIIKQ